MAIGEDQMLPVDDVVAHPTADLALLLTPVDASVSSLEMTKGSPQPDDLSVLYGYPQSVAIDLKQRFIGSRTQRFRLSGRRSVSQNVSVLTWPGATSRKSGGTIDTASCRCTRPKSVSRTR